MQPTVTVRAVNFRFANLASCQSGSSRELLLADFLEKFVFQGFLRENSF
jgi:hypothetical protein